MPICCRDKAQIRSNHRQQISVVTGSDLNGLCDAVILDARHGREQKQRALKQAENAKWLRRLAGGAADRNRTGTPKLERDFKSRASASSATAAYIKNTVTITLPAQR